jgi:hypothetical protein
MKQVLEDAGEELKRVEHLVYVSLKYTRTVDVLKNVLTRMTDAYQLMMEALYLLQKDDEEVPDAPVRLGKEIQQLYEDKEWIVETVDKYLLLRKILRAPNPIREQEYRRHVAMKTFIDGREEVFNIDLAMQHFEHMKEFYQKLRREFLDEEIHG